MIRARAAILVAPRQPLIIDEIELPEPGEGEVLVRNLASGICHSQLHQMQAPAAHGRPLLLGHESAGEVVAVGAGVAHVRAGDRVVVTWQRRDARSGDHLAPPVQPARRRGEAIGDQYGGIYTWSEMSLVRQEHVVQAPGDLPAEALSIVGWAVMTGAGAVINSADVQAGQSAAVIGAGGVGLCAIAALAVRGAAPIIAVDLDDTKLTFAQRFGATILINAARDDAVAQIREASGGGVDFAFDCIGRDATIHQIVEAVRAADWGVSRGGTAVLVGWPKGEASINVLDLVIGEKRLMGSAGGSSRPERDFPIFLEWYRQGVLPLDVLVSERWPLAAINEGTDRLAQGQVLGRSVIIF